MKKLLILGASEFQIPLIESAKKRGLHTCVIDINPHAPACNTADEYIECSLKDFEKALGIAKRYKPDGITAGMCDVAVLSAARICNELGLPGLGVETAIKATNKYEMIRSFSTNSVPCPKFKLLNNNDNYSISDVPDLPFIVKPIDMAGSRGINLVDSYEEMPSLISDSIRASDSGNVILEEYLVGPEVSVEMVVINRQPTVLQITDKITSGAPHFVELGHTQPSILPNPVKEEICEVAKSAVYSLGISNSIVHAEIIITKDGAKMVELGARMGGDGIQQQLIKLSTGIDLPNFAIDLALGRPLYVPKSTINKYSMIRFIPSMVGIINDIIIEDSISGLPGLVSYKLFCNRGEYFEERNDNSGRFGYVIAQADSHDATISCCDKAISKIKFIVSSNIISTSTNV